MKRTTTTLPRLRLLLFSFFYLDLTTALIPSTGFSRFRKTATSTAKSTFTIMAGVRKRHNPAGQGLNSDSFDRDEGHGNLSMLFRRGKLNKSTSSTDKSPSSSTSRLGRLGGASSFGGAAGPDVPSSRARAEDSVIHLGKLRIPESRRIKLSRRAMGNVGPDVAVSNPASLEDTLENVQEEREEEEKEREDRWEHDRKIEIDVERVMMTHSFIGGPSVIPYGVGDDQSERGVVQIPLSYSVKQTVEFIRAVSTADRQKEALPAKGKDRTVELLHGDERLPAALTDRIYVTEDGKLKGFITMAALLTNQPNTLVSTLVRDLEEMLQEGDSWEDAARRLRQANVMAAPVVDDEGVLVAVLNPSDLLNEMEIEATDDIMRQSGSGGGESYFGTPLPRLVASRVGWLVGLLALQSFSSLILQSFQNVIERNIVIALFLTMLTGTAGNAGNQSSAIVIRGLATGEIHQGNKFQVIWREARAAIASAAVLSVASFVRVLLTPGATTIATLAVSIAMGATVVGAVMFGTVAPIILHGMGVDPVNFASPALATLTDVSGVFILCSVAKLMLGAAP